MADAGVGHNNGSATPYSWTSTSRTASVDQDVSLLSWGSGSAPSLPSVDNEQTVSATIDETL